MSWDSGRATTPTLRVRINHGRTQKDGWHFDSTVELVASLDLDASEIADTITYWLERARVLGETERDIRNARDRKGDDTR